MSWEENVPILKSRLEPGLHLLILKDILLKQRPFLVGLKSYWDKSESVYFQWPLFCHHKYLPRILVFLALLLQTLPGKSFHKATKKGIRFNRLNLKRLADLFQCKYFVEASFDNISKDRRKSKHKNSSKFNIMTVVKGHQKRLISAEKTRIRIFRPEASTVLHSTGFAYTLQIIFKKAKFALATLDVYVWELLRSNK